MNILAFLLAVAGVVVCLLAITPRNRYTNVALGLALIGTAWIVQAVWVTEHVVKVG